MEEKEVLTLDEACAYLRLTRKTLVKYLQDGTIPGNKIGRQWRILKKDIDNYISKGKKAN